eukprot:CAMPEP_0119290608 /NCGR_PEP_ID=MMETSP1329-20130426/41004_1 /TAXON_ID=114041 /ORGANISM="Genus nov. species nov., Strain RCC1024" /LENGTH=58 /DNA_ID=CAMNT_0007291429 /DNA_START=156 /DNA_END=329 /DNA_ORIENTATION=-
MAAMFGGARTRSDDTSALAYTAPKQPGKEKPTPAPAPAAAAAPAVSYAYTGKCALYRL